MDKNVKILYVDDEELNLTLFKLNFNKNFNVIVAQSGQKGLEILKQDNEINIVISDMKMPGMTGIEFIRLAKIDYPNKNFFILTGFDITEEIADALNEKLIHKYFRKPFRKVEIESSILEVFNLN